MDLILEFGSHPDQYNSMPYQLSQISYLSIRYVTLGYVTTSSRSANFTASSLSVFILADAIAIVLNGFDNET